MKYVFLALITVFVLSCSNNVEQDEDKSTENLTTDISDENDEGNETTEAVVPDMEFETSNNGKVVALSSAAFVSEIFDFKNETEWNFKGKAPCIVDFYATWCGPCKQVAPIMDELAKKYQKQINIYKVDTDKESDLAMAFGIQSIPSILFCPMEGEPYMYVGAFGKSDYEDLINEHFFK